MSKHHSTNRVREIPLEWELPRLEMEIKFGPHDDQRKAAMKRYLDLTEREFGQ